ncbi:MAG TPA: hypothetical protein VLI06_14205 [Solimonas sp.]|nr:hypothetical protein [Solimonas sp.]
MTPERSASYSILHLCNYSILILAIGGGLGFAVLGGFWPPPEAHLSAAEIGAFFRENSVGIRMGMELMFLCVPFYLTWTAAMARIMERIQKDSMNILPALIVVSGAVAMLTLLGPPIAWMTAAFRPGVRSNEEIQLLYDLGWFIFDPPFMIFAIEWGAMGICMLMDKREKPLFPPWIAWFGFFTCATFISTALIPFLTTGIFAWHGLVTFWLVFVTFFVYLFCMVPLTRKALLRLEAEDQETACRNVDKLEIEESSMTTA